MIKFRDVSIKWKVLGIALFGPIFIAILFSYERISDIRQGAIDKMVEKSAAIVLMAESGRQSMAKRLEMGLTKPFDEVPAEMIIHAVPVVAAMEMAAENAKELGYEFRAPKVSPRNPKNKPTEEELGYLKRIKAEKLKELVVVKDDEVRYLRPVTLTRDCLYCHGDPKGEKDPTGGIKEGWRAGEIHGAFQVTSSLAEVNAQIAQTRLSIAGWTVGILTGVTLLVWFILQTNIIKPFQRITHHIKNVAGGNLTGRLNFTRTDEIGSIAKDMDEMSQKLRELIQSITESSGQLFQASSQVGQSSGDISQGTTLLNQRSNSVAAAAEEMSANMNSVAAATEEASTNIALVASSTEDMAATIREIAKSTEQTQAVTSRAVSRAESASSHVDQLGEAASRIGAVTETINEISAQTNLLALNATIEAARAGEAGKGFAVVANEIKGLANQTAEATQEIKSRIEGIQSRTDSTVAEILEITKVIAEVNEIVNQVAAAVEQQNATTSEIAQNIAQATQGIQEVTENVSQGSVAAEDVASNISQVSVASADIDKQTGELELKAAELKTLSERLTETIGSFTV